MKTTNFFPGDYRDVKDIDVIQYADLKELNIDTTENFREARKEVFEELKIYRGFVEKHSIDIPADIETYEDLQDYIGTHFGMAWEEYYSGLQEQTQESETKEISGPWLVLSKEEGTDPNSPVIAVIHDKDSHAKYTQEATGGNIEFDYIPMGVVKEAVVTLEALKGLIEYLGKDWENDPVVKKAVQQINKAEGRAS